MFRIGFARPRVRAALTVVASAVAVGGVAAFGVDDGHAARDVRLLSGAAWLSSAKVGQATLLDGTSVEVLAQVPVASAGNALEVVQQGSNAYAVDQNAGTVRRIDGATFEVTPPVAPIPDAQAGLTAIPGQDALYMLDNKRGVLANTDPRTLDRRGELLSLASQLSAGTAIVDDAGTLWAIDTATGDVTRVAGGSRSVRRQVAQPGRAIMTVANGHPVVVDPGARHVITLDGRTGSPNTTLDLDLRPEDSIQVSGSQHSERVYVVTGRGALTICDLAAGRCDDVVPLAAGNQFGAAVEAGNKLFVPDHTNGQVWIVDLSAHRVVGKPTVLTPPGAFQLLTRDGMVFFNDPFSQRAGVVRLDGTVTQAQKYDPGDPARGVNVPHDPGQQPAPKDPQQPKQNDPAQPKPESPRQPKPENPRTQPDPNHPPPPNEPTPPELQIVMSDASPMVDQPITITVRNNKTPAVKSAKWTFGDNTTGAAIETSHKWATAGTYQLSVQAILEDGREVAKSDTITVTAKPNHKLTVTIFDGGGTITGGGIDCPGTCSIDLVEDTAVTLIANPQAPNTAGPWTGDCTGSGIRCDLVMKADKNVTYTFTKPPPVNVNVTPPSGGTIDSDDNRIHCPGICSASYQQNKTVKLTANPDQAHKFGGWGNACAGQGATCSLTTGTSDAGVSATFSAKRVFNIYLAVSSLGTPDPHYGHGSVTGPNNLFCAHEHPPEATCRADFFEGDSVTLTSNPEPGYHFLEWTQHDGTKTRARTLTITVDQQQTVFAVFEKD